MTLAVITTCYNEVETTGEVIDRIELYRKNIDAYINGITYDNHLPETLAAFNAAKTLFHKFKVGAS